MSPTTESDEGVQFGQFNGRRSSQRTAQRVYGAAARYVDADLADRIEGAKEWRKSYLGPVRDLVAAGAGSAKDALRIASDGLEALGASMEFVRDGRDEQLGAAVGEATESGFETVTIEGRGDRTKPALTIPFRDEPLAGDELNRKLDAWVEAGTIETSCAEAVRMVASNPDWLDLSDLRFVLLGAASEMGPLPWLCRWSADVVAVDLPRPHLWDHIKGLAEGGTGRVHAPVRPGSERGEVAGADLLTETPEIAAWLGGLGGPFVVGNYVYADGATFVRLAAAADALIETMQDRGDLATLAYLATPTDVFAVPPSVVADVRAKQAAGSRGGFLRRISGGRLYRPQYEATVQSDDGREWGIFDCLVPQQGPNYALAKTAQRWRAVTARAQGVRTSANVAPATTTRSVVKNRVLAAAYAGAHRFGVDIFRSATSSALEAALLVHDLRNDPLPARAGESAGHPYDLFVDQAAHGGLWRMEHEPRSVLPLSVIVGLARRGRPPR
jgi:hypothetical protein